MSPENPQSGKRGAKGNIRTGSDRTADTGFDQSEPSSTQYDPVNPSAASTSSANVQGAAYGSTSGTAPSASGAWTESASSSAGSRASGILHQVRNKATSQLNQQKERATEGLGNVAQAVRSSTERLREQQYDTVAQFVERAADQIERFSTHLRDRDINELVGEAQRFARQQPAVFIGSSFAAGLLAARFIKASRPAPSFESRGFGDYGGDPNTGATGGGPYTSGGSYSGGTYTGGGSFGARSDRDTSVNTSMDRPGDVTGRGDV
jgi:ElaB/YqjD/DUF883 family membrane-anchored ribosome-binding protein